MEACLSDSSYPGTKALRTGKYLLEVTASLVVADEQIHQYDRRMNARYWLEHGLDNAVTEFAESSATLCLHLLAAAQEGNAPARLKANW